VLAGCAGSRITADGVKILKKRGIRLLRVDGTTNAADEALLEEARLGSEGRQVSVGVVLAGAAALTPAVCGQTASRNTCGVLPDFDQSLTCGVCHNVPFVLVWTPENAREW
jgi:hypothetical protein